MPATAWLVAVLVSELCCQPVPSSQRELAVEVLYLCFAISAFVSMSSHCEIDLSPHHHAWHASLSSYRMSVRSSRIPTMPPVQSLRLREESGEALRLRGCLKRSYELLACVLV